MSLGFDVSHTMQSIRTILNKHTKGIDWSKVPEELPAPTKKDVTFTRITDPEIIIKIDKACKAGAMIKDVAKEFGSSTTTVSYIRSRKNRFHDMPHDEKGIRAWVKRKEKERLAKWKI